MDEAKETDRLTDLTRKTKNVQGLMLHNILVMEQKRGVQLKHLDQTAEEIKESGEEFEKISAELQKQQKRKRIKKRATYTLMIIVVLCIGVIVLILIIIVLIRR